MHVLREFTAQCHAFKLQRRTVSFNAERQMFLRPEGHYKCKNEITLTEGVNGFT